MIGRVVVLGRQSEADRIVADEEVPALPLAGKGVTAHFLWGRDTPATLPDAGARPLLDKPFPTPEGLRFSALTIPAGASGDYHAFVVSALGELADPARPGRHWTPTIDCIAMFRGELLLETDEGETVVGPGDSVIVNGNWHRWTNRGAEDAILFAFQVGVAGTGPAA